MKPFQSLKAFADSFRSGTNGTAAGLAREYVDSLMSFLASPRLARRPRISGPPRCAAARSLAARSAAWRPAREQEPGP